jgi:hypothetical protein
MMANGSIYVYQKRNPKKKATTYNAEHFLVAEKELGRKIKKEERMFHINRNNADNRPENLYLFKNQAEALKTFYNGVKNLKSNII